MALISIFYIATLILEITSGLNSDVIKSRLLNVDSTLFFIPEFPGMIMAFLISSRYSDSGPTVHLKEVLVLTWFHGNC